MDGQADYYKVRDKINWKCVVYKIFTYYPIVSLTVLIALEYITSWHFRYSWCVVFVGFIMQIICFINITYPIFFKDDIVYGSIYKYKVITKFEYLMLKALKGKKVKVICTYKNYDTMKILEELEKIHTYRNLL